jgi:hypothetical protein
MYQQDNISNELQELSPTLAAIPKLNVFTVPGGYFDLLSTQLLLLTRPGEEQNVTEAMNASVPEGYFENLAGNIMARIKRESFSEVALETHAVSSLVAEIGNKNIYQAPEGYFENLANTILAKTNSFHGSEVTVETASISEMVAGIGHKNVYSVPEGYFTELSQAVNAKVLHPAKIVTMKSRFTAFRYAAAAVVTGLVGLSIIFLLNKNNGDKTNAVQTAAVITEAKQIMRTNSFDKEFSSVSDDAIVSFLESKGQDVEAALVASLTDEKNLPDADDYIINENTLDEVLKTLDLNN